MNTGEYPSRKFIKQRFYYESGKLYNKKTTSTRSIKDKVAGSRTKDGYISVRIDRKDYKVNRLVWIYHYGKKNSKLLVSHINHIKDDNHIENLKLVNYNHYFSKKAKGYSWCSKRNKYISRIKVNKKIIYLGGFDHSDDARNAYLKAKEKYHKYVSFK